MVKNFSYHFVFLKYNYLYSIYFLPINSKSPQFILIETVKIIMRISFILMIKINVLKVYPKKAMEKHPKIKAL